MSGKDRITREVTPCVEVLLGSERRRPRQLRHDPAGELAIDEGRATLTHLDRQRILLDPDGTLYEALLSTPPEWLESVFEVHAEPGQDVPAATAVVTPDGSLGEAGFRVASGSPGRTADAMLVEVGRSAPPTQLALPATGVLAFHDLDAVEQLPVLLHGMGTGRVALRELRIRVDPLAFQGLGRRPPFVSEVLEAVADALGVPSAQLGRELLFRQRLGGSSLNIRRHLLPDPYHAAFTLRPHRTRGLLPATTLFPLPQRGSRRELMRGTPESEHERLLAYLELLEDPAPRLVAAARRDLFLVSLHFLPNPDIPLRPLHGGIARWRDGVAIPLTGLSAPTG